jgi:excisionase family DNA binding protein
MAGPKTTTRTKPPARTKKATITGATPGGDASPARSAEWPEVLTLAEAAAYLRVPELEVERIAGTQGLAGRRIGSEWRFSRAAIQDWLRRPSMKESLLRLAGSWKDDPDVEEMLAEIYRQRGRPMIEESP